MEFNDDIFLSLSLFTTHQAFCCNIYPIFTQTMVIKRWWPGDNDDHHLTWAIIYQPTHKNTLNTPINFSEKIPPIEMNFKMAEIYIQIVSVVVDHHWCPTIFFVVEKFSMFFLFQKSKSKYFKMTLKKTNLKIWKFKIFEAEKIKETNENILCSRCLTVLSRIVHRWCLISISIQLNQSVKTSI